MKANGTIVRMDALKAGDRVVAADATGALTVDTVSSLSLADIDAEATYVTLATDNETLTLTAGHHLPVGTTCCAALKKAKDVVIGDMIWTAAGDVKAVVTKSLKTEKAGRFSPVLINGAFPIVNDIITAFDSISKVKLASSFLWLFEATSTTGALRAFLPTRKYIAASI